VLPAILRREREMNNETNATTNNDSMESKMTPPSPSPSPSSSISYCSTITDKVLGKWCEVKRGFILQYYYDLTQQDDKNTNVPSIESAAETGKVM
jgi:hypothetical protein